MGFRVAAGKFDVGKNAATADYIFREAFYIINAIMSRKDGIFTWLYIT
jgi:hypothetical protein